MEEKLRLEGKEEQKELQYPSEDLLESETLKKEIEDQKTEKEKLKKEIETIDQEIEHINQSLKNLKEEKQKLEEEIKPFLIEKEKEEQARQKNSKTKKNRGALFPVDKRNSENKNNEE